MIYPVGIEIFVEVAVPFMDRRNDGEFSMGIRKVPGCYRLAEVRTAKTRSLAAFPLKIQPL